MNSAGTKVTEADIALALAASQNPGWARNEFLPFLSTLQDAGFDIDPNLVFRSAVAIGLGQARLKDVPRSWWGGTGLTGSWDRTKHAWQDVVNYVEQRGILSSDVLPTKNALIPLVILVDRLPNALSDTSPFAWLLHATRSGRYSGAAISALDRDVKTIREATSAGDALERMRLEMGSWEPFSSTDFLADYRDRVMRLMLYLLMWHRGARDWVTKQRLGFQGPELLERFDPDWHHIFPRAFLRDEGVPEERWNLFANIAVVASNTNKGFGAKPPEAYLDYFEVGDDLLTEQLVSTDRGALRAQDYESFLATRARTLADAANRYYDGLAGSRSDASAA